MRHDEDSSDVPQLGCWQVEDLVDIVVLLDGTPAKILDVLERTGIADPELEAHDRSFPVDVVIAPFTQPCLPTLIASTTIASSAGVL